jgi:predicted RNase H-like nuclease
LRVYQGKSIAGSSVIPTGVHGDHHGPALADAVLGVDAAWTLSHPSGAALIARRGIRWQCLRLAASYADFVGGIQGESLSSPSIPIPEVLHTCAALLDGLSPAVVAVDMPIGNAPISARRGADDEVSRAFGHAACSVHSPTLTRPAVVSEDFVQSFQRARYQCDFGAGVPAGALIEVYPHVALLALAQVERRLPYKAAKTGIYWKVVPIRERRSRLIRQWRDIVRLLESHIDGIDLILPNEEASVKTLKAAEDKIDALVCAWVGSLYLDGQAIALGDLTSAIWIPRAALRFSRARRT